MPEARLRIGINAVPLLTPLAGIGRYTFHLIRELQPLLPEPPLLFYGSDWSTEMRGNASPSVAGAKRWIGRAIPDAYKLARFLQQRRFTAGARRNGITLYHEPNYLAFRFDGPAVVTVHDLSWIRYPETHPRERVKMMNEIVPRVVAEAAEIIVDSEFVRGEVVAHFGVAPERVTAIPLGVTDEFRPKTAESSAASLSAYGVRHGQYVLTVGTLEPRKNLSTVIEAFAGWPAPLRKRFPLVIAGLPGWGNGRADESSRRMVEAGEILVLGFVPQEDLPALYAGARMFVYPSIYEGFGLPPLEAMACGAPVIVSRRASLPEIVGVAGTMVEGLDAVELRERMRVLAEDDAVHRERSTAGLERSRRFTWRACAEGTLAIYRRAHAGAP
jgi:glycosyltransferase involved in cell wall biosynthesis